MWSRHTGRSTARRPGRIHCISIVYAIKCISLRRRGPRHPPTFSSNWTRPRATTSALAKPKPDRSGPQSARLRYPANSMIIRFGDYELDGSRYELRRAGVPVPIERRVFDLVLYLAINSFRVVPKAELLSEVWSGRHVADASVSVAVTAARRALGDDPTKQAVIRTCHGRGYQFVSPCDPDTATSPSIAERSHDLGRDQADLVGRTIEVASISGAVSRLIEGQSTLLLISGEPGIGKTRLLDELISIGTARRLDIVTGRCAESGNAPAMWPWTQVFRSLIQSRSAAWADRLLPRHLQSLAMLVPEVLPESLHIQPATESAETARFQLFESLLESLVVLLENRAAFVALDDLHRADHSTLRFFRFAARELRRHPLVFVGTYRHGELRSSQIHTDVLAELAREPHSVALNLEGLNESETMQLFKRLSSAQLSAQEENQVYAQTGGNPFFIRQLASIFRCDPGRSMRPEEGSLPPTLRLAILGQISALSRDARHALSAAAVIGREFSPLILAAVVDLDRARLDAALDELLDSQVLRRFSDGTDSLRFMHILVRDALYGEIGLADRRTLHERIGRSLAPFHHDSAAQHAGGVAYHLFQAQTPESLSDAKLLCETAAQAAATRSAHDDSERHYLLALEALRLTDPSNETERCRLLLALGTEQCRSGNRTGAKETFSTAASIARSLGATEAVARAALGVAPGFLAAEAGASDAFLEDLLSEALASLNRSSSALRARVAARLAMALHWSEAKARTHSLLALARESVDAVDDPGTHLHVLVARWFCEWHHERFDERSVLADEIQSTAEFIHDREMTLMGMMLRQVGMLERGDLVAFDASLEAFSRLAADLRQPQSLWYTPLYCSMRALLDGATERAMRLQAELATVVARIEDANAFHSLIAQSSILAWEMGTLASSISGLVEGARRYPTIAGFRAAVSWAHAKTDREPEARRELDTLARSQFSDFSERFDWPTAAALCSEVACDLGDRPRAADLYEILRPLRERFLLVGLGVASFGSASRLLARLAETMGRPDLAEGHFRVAIERNAAAGAHAWTAHSKFEYALLLARTGGPAGRDYRVQLASEALETASDLGLVSLRGRVESFLEDASERRALRRQS